MKLSKIFEEITKEKALFWYYLCSLILPNILLFFTESISPFAKICNICFPLFAFWYVLTLGKNMGKMYWCLFLFIFFDAFEIVLLNLFNRGSAVAVDMFLNIVTSNPGEIQELLDGLIPAVAFVFIIYLGAMALSIRSILKKGILSKDFRLTQRKFALPALIVSCVLTIICQFVTPNFNIKNDIFPINTLYNLGSAIGRTIKVSNYHNSSNDFTFDAKSNRNKDDEEIYVLVIGETARAGNFGVYGYERNTTPNLCGLTDSIIAYNHAVTQSNTTHKSVPIILSAVSAENFEDIYKQKSIISAYKEAGFYTVFYSNQLPNKSFIEFFSEEADTHKFIKEDYGFTANVPDDKLISLLNEEVTKEHKKKFIVLHTYGSHFNYQERYEPNEAYFTPDYLPSASRDYKQNLINAYDNTIREADRIVSNVINILTKTGKKAVMIYVADHGEDIYDDSRNLFLHASPIPSYYQVHVPFIIWASTEYKNAFPSIWQNLNLHKESQISTNLAIFHTLIELSGIGTKFYNASNSLANKNFTDSKRVYLDDHNDAQLLINMNLMPEDITQFQKHGIDIKAK